MDRIKRLAENCHGLQVRKYSKPRIVAELKKFCGFRTGFPRVPLVRWWYWIGIPFAVDGETVDGVRQEAQAGVRHLSGAAGTIRTDFTGTTLKFS